MDGLSGGSRPHIEVFVRNDAAVGIAAKEVDTGGDKLTLPLRFGLTTRIVRIVKLLDQDRAMLRLLGY